MIASFILQIATASAKIDRKAIGYEGVTDAQTGINGLVSAAYFWAGIVAVVVIIIAGYLYATSQGDAAKTKRAKDAILGAVVGLVVIVFAFAITQYIIGRF